MTSMRACCNFASPPRLRVCVSSTATARHKGVGCFEPPWGGGRRRTVWWCGLGVRGDEMPSQGCDGERKCITAPCDLHGARDVRLWGAASTDGVGRTVVFFASSRSGCSEPAEGGYAVVRGLTPGRGRFAVTANRCDDEPRARGVRGSNPRAPGRRRAARSWLLRPRREEGRRRRDLPAARVLRGGTLAAAARPMARGSGSR